MASAFSTEQLQYLNNRGIDLAAVIPVAELPEAILTPLQESGVDVWPDARLIVLANAGAKFWDRMRAEQSATGVGSNHSVDHPVDDYSKRIAHDFIQRFLADAENQLLYPTRLPINLIALGELFGWSAPSRLGMGINREYGLWFAYRVAILTQANLGQSTRLPAADVCAQCIAKPCISACPTNAVSAQSAFDLEACSDWRLRDDSVCQLTCLSRKSCPVGSEYHYDDEQLAHHMRRSLPALRAWRQSRDGD